MFPEEIKVVMAEYDSTSEAVLTELFHLIGHARSEMEAAWRFVRSGALVLGTIEHAELQHVHGLMSRYWDRPMDLPMAPSCIWRGVNFFL